MTTTIRVLGAIFMAALLHTSVSAQGEVTRRVEPRDAKGRDAKGRETDGRRTEVKGERDTSDTARASETERRSETERVTERGDGRRGGDGGRGGNGGGSGNGGGRRNVVLTPKGYEHIVDRHSFGSASLNAGKFAEGTTESRLRQMINETTQHGKDRPNTGGRTGTIYEHEFDKSVGVDSRGTATSRLRVVVSPSHEVITAFPY